MTSILRSVDQHTETPLVEYPGRVSGGFKDITQDSPKTQADQNKVYSMRNESPSFSCRCFMEWNFDSFSISRDERVLIFAHLRQAEQIVSH